MRVTVELNGHLSWYVEDGVRVHEVEVEPDSTVGELIEGLGVPPIEVAFASIEDERIDLDRVLRDGDRVSLVPIIAGG